LKRAPAAASQNTNLFEWTLKKVDGSVGGVGGKTIRVDIKVHD